MKFSSLDAMHYGAAGLLLGLAAMAQMGVQLPGIAVDPKIAGAAGIGILVAGLKSGWKSGGNAVLALALGAGALLGTLGISTADAQTAASTPAAVAATAAPIVITKADPITGLLGGSYAAGGPGLYFGINTMGAAGAIDGGPVGATQIQGEIGATIGYGAPIGATAGNFWFAEARFDFANVNGSATGLSMTGPADFEQMVGLGSPISALLNLFPSITGGLSVPSLPLLPAGVTAGPSYPFIYAGVHEQDVSAQVGVASGQAWLISPALGIGMQTRLSDHVVAVPTAEWDMESSGLGIGTDKIKFGNAARVGFQLIY